jgi:biotin carboxylase
MKRVLVPNGNYTDIRLIKAFKKMGFYVITSGNAPELEGHRYADEYAPHDYSDHEGMLELAKKLNIDYISACSNDFGVTTAAYIAENLGLPGHDTFKNARIIAEKDLFKKFALENDLQVIPSHWFDDEEKAVEFVKDAEYPLIVKPTDLGGGKGVTRVQDYDNAVKAIKLAFSKSKRKHIVIEPFIEGEQGSITTFLINEKVVTWITFNELDSFYNPFLVGYTTSPANGMPEVGEALIEQINKMASLLHLVDGIFHVQYRMHHGKPLIMECMRRCLGNHSLKTASMLADLEWEEWIAKSYCGFDCSDIPRCYCGDKQMSHFYIQAPKNGKVKNVRISDELEPYVADRIMQWTPGMEIEAYEKEMLGFLFMQYPDRETRDRMAARYRELIVVEME